MTEFNNRIENLWSKLDEVKKEKNAMRNKCDSYRIRFENKQGELDKANAIIETLKVDNSEFCN